MLVTVVDETVLVTQAAHRLSLSSDMKTAFAGSLSELSLVFEANGQLDLLLVNVTGGTNCYETAAHIRRSGYRGRVLALVDDLSAPDVRHLTQLRTVQCLARPGSSNELDDVLRRAIHSAPAAAVSAEPAAAPTAFHGIVGR